LILRLAKPDSTDLLIQTRARPDDSLKAIYDPPNSFLIQTIIDLALPKGYREFRRGK
jgi:hypothetical protein